MCTCCPFEAAPVATSNPPPLFCCSNSQIILWSLALLTRHSIYKIMGSQSDSYNQEGSSNRPSSWTLTCSQYHLLTRQIHLTPRLSDDRSHKAAQVGSTFLPSFAATIRQFSSPDYTWSPVPRGYPSRKQRPSSLPLLQPNGQLSSASHQPSLMLLLILSIVLPNLMIHGNRSHEAAQVSSNNLPSFLCCYYQAVLVPRLSSYFLVGPNNLPSFLCCNLLGFCYRSSWRGFHLQQTTHHTLQSPEGMVTSHTRLPE